MKHVKLWLFTLTLGVACVLTQGVLSQEEDFDFDALLDEIASDIDGGESEASETAEPAESADEPAPKTPVETPEETSSPSEPEPETAPSSVGDEDLDALLDELDSDSGDAGEDYPVKGEVIADEPAAEPTAEAASSSSGDLNDLLSELDSVADEVEESIEGIEDVADEMADSAADAVESLADADVDAGLDELVEEAETEVEEVAESIEETMDEPLEEIAEEVSEEAAGEIVDEVAEEMPVGEEAVVEAEMSEEPASMEEPPAAEVVEVAEEESLDDLLDGIDEEVAPEAVAAEVAADELDDLFSDLDEDAAEAVDDSAMAVEDVVSDLGADEPVAAIEEEASAEMDDLDNLLGDLDEEADDLDDLLGLDEEDEDMADSGDESDTAEASEEMDDSAADEEGDAMAGEDAAEADTLEAAATPEELGYQFEIRERAREIEGFEQLEAGFDALDKKEFDKASEKFSKALGNIPDRKKTKDDIKAAHWGLGEANFRLGEQLAKAKDFKGARERLNLAKVHAPENVGITKLLKKVESRIKKIEDAIEKGVPVDERAETIERFDDCAKWVAEAKAYYEVGDFDRATTLFEQCLILDPYNIDSFRWLKKIAERKLVVTEEQRLLAKADMIQQVRDAWSPPIRREISEDDIRLTSSPTGPSTADALKEELGRTIIDKIEFRQANIVDVVEYLVDESVTDSNPTGINIVLNLGIASVGSTADTGGGEETGLDEPGFDEDESYETDTGGIPAITLNLRRVNMLDAIRYITEVSGLSYRIEDVAVIITPEGVSQKHVITKIFPVVPAFMETLTTPTGFDSGFDDGGDGGFDGGFGDPEQPVDNSREEIKQFFEGAGVQFPKGTSIVYNPAISQLIVANTPKNMDIFERILNQLNLTPKQVEIEARFVEVNQNDLTQLGLEWIMTDDFEIARRRDSVNVAGQERIVAGADPEGISKGNRFFGVRDDLDEVNPVSTGEFGGTADFVGDILSISGVLTNPELTVVLHALSQIGGSDVLSAPRVTTISGVNAQIQVVEELIYPTEFEEQETSIDDVVVSAGLGATVDFTGFSSPPIPGSFETRELGVILNVTPTVDNDGYTINLTMQPEVSELLGWIDYGVVGAPIRLPIFGSRNVTTSIVIWDGQTVVMGGLIREKLVTIEDKIPLLGDIPLIGRLFKNEGERSEKQNLLIFVTARLVNPGGKPIRKIDAINQPVGAPAEGGEFSATSN